jgi:hypothetical protein
MSDRCSDCGRDICNCAPSFGVRQAVRDAVDNMGPQPGPQYGTCKRCLCWPCQCKHNQKRDNDPVNHPSHYTSHPSGIECIRVTEHMNFNVGNAVKYLWRCDHKGSLISDLEKARWYIDREIARLKKP